MFEYWTQPLAYMALAILTLISVYAVIRVGYRAYYRARAEYESEKKMAEKAKEDQ